MVATLWTFMSSYTHFRKSVSIKLYYTIYIYIGRRNYSLFFYFFVNLEHFWAFLNFIIEIRKLCQTLNHITTTTKTLIPNTESRLHEMK